MDGHSKREVLEMFNTNQKNVIARGVSQEIVVQSACQYDVTSRVSDFQNGDLNIHRGDG